MQRRWKQIAGLIGGISFFVAATTVSMAAASENESFFDKINTILQALGEKPIREIPAVLTTTMTPVAIAPEEKVPIPADEAIQRVQSMNYRIFRAVWENSDKERNILLSPYSVQQIFATLAANSQDRKNLEVLRPYDDVNILGEKLMNTETGNLILLNKKLASALKSPVGDLKVVDYPSEALAEKINLQQSILGEVLDGEAPNGDLTFLSAVHYFAKWQAPFSKTDTRNREFTKSDGTVIMVPTMAKHFVTGSGKVTDTYEMFSLGTESGATVYFVKPVAGQEESIANMLESVIAEYKAGNGTQRDVYFEMPKVHFRDSVNLITSLYTLGATQLFDGITFSQITGDQRYRLSAAKQTASIDFNEVSGEAKAITEFGFRATAMVLEPKQPLAIKMDRPYFAVIEDSLQGTNQATAVFINYICDPAAQ